MLWAGGSHDGLSLLSPNVTPHNTFAYPGSKLLFWQLLIYVYVSSIASRIWSQTRVIDSPVWLIHVLHSHFGVYFQAWILKRRLITLYLQGSSALIRGVKYVAFVRERVNLRLHQTGASSDSLYLFLIWKRISQFKHTNWNKWVVIIHQWHSQFMSKYKCTILNNICLCGYKLFTK